MSILLYPLVFTNYYLFVLLTGAERLKFSILFLLLSICCGRHWLRYIFLAAAPLAHVQTFLLLAALGFESLWSRLSLLFRKKASWQSAKGRWLIWGGVVGIVAIAIWQRSYILDKVTNYALYSGDPVMLLALAGASLLTFTSNIGPTFGIVFLSVMSIVLGDARLNMVGYIVYLYFCIEGRRSNNPFLLAISLYLSYKSIGFMDSVEKFGHGFG